MSKPKVPLTRVHYKGSVVAPIKYAEPKIIKPEMNHDGNFWIYAYLLYHDLFVPDNKVNGGYVHTEA